MLGVAFYFVYRPSKAGCEVHGACAVPAPPHLNRYNKTILWGVTLLTLALLAYPEIEVQKAKTALKSSPTVAIADKSQTVVLGLKNLTCEACSLQIVNSLNKTTGVYDAKVHFNSKQITIQYNPDQVNTKQLRAKITKLGYPATIVHDK